MACNDGTCLPPDEVDLVFDLTAATPVKEIAQTTTTTTPSKNEVVEKEIKNTPEKTTTQKGLWGAPLRLVSAFVPPQYYSEAPSGVGSTASKTNQQHNDNLPEGAHMMTPHNIIAFNDYEKGLAYARKVGKPVLLDFTGWACVNCRKMEQSVWMQPKVLSVLQKKVDGNGVVSLKTDVDKNTITNLAIPETLKGQRVTSIGNYAFSECTALQSITIPNSVSFIGDTAFNDCTALQSITIPNSVTSIGNYAFSLCESLQNITIPNSVTSIGDYAFWSCKALQSITIPNSVTSIGDWTFSGCTALKSITIPNTVTRISDGAFEGCKALQSITIPNSVTSIGDDAFEDCKFLQSITIPNSVTSIGDNVFECCFALQTIRVPSAKKSAWEAKLKSGNTANILALLTLWACNDDKHTEKWNPDWGILKTYKGKYLDKVAMPLGGIGTGTVSIGGRGDLRDWELGNRGAIGYLPAFKFVPPTISNGPFFALYYKQKGQKANIKVLEGPIDVKEYEGDWGADAVNSGFPRFESTTFATAYPLAQINFQDKNVPLDVRLEAFNPLIMGDENKSGIPVAVLRYVLTNNTDKPIEASVVGMVPNYIGVDGWGGKPKDNFNQYREKDNIKGLYMFSKGVPKDDVNAGTMALTTLSKTGEVSYRTSWKYIGWNWTFREFWDDFIADGILKDFPDIIPVSKNTKDDIFVGNGLRVRRGSKIKTPPATLAVKEKIEPSESKTVTFMLTWHFPNRRAWDHGNGTYTGGSGDDIVGNYYTTQYKDAWEVAQKTAEDLKTLETETVSFVNSLVKSDLPAVLKEAGLFNLSTLRSQTVFRTADGYPFGFEGTGSIHGTKIGAAKSSGWGFGTCTHVWNYESTTPFVFGNLAMKFRAVEFLHSVNENGGQSHRVGLPLEKRGRFFKNWAADGQMGTLIKIYRDWQLSGDDDQLKKMYPNIKKSMAFAWTGIWDQNKDGVMEGSQHNTMDINYKGPNPQMAVWYLGALKASEKMANYLGDKTFAKECKTLFDKGSKWVDEQLFNGDYYEHLIPEGHEKIAQLGKGCLVDQLVGQYLSHTADLGYVLSKKNIQKTLKSIMKYNLVSNFNEHFNTFRSFGVGDEKGLIMASYPKGDLLDFPFPYYTEIMTGFEYSTGAHMLYEGQTENGLSVFKNIRNRYDGYKRNPFNEGEYGHHYARAMAAWAGILGMSTPYSKSQEGVYKVNFRATDPWNSKIEQTAIFVVNYSGSHNTKLTYDYPNVNDDVAIPLSTYGNYIRTGSGNDYFYAHAGIIDGGSGNNSYRITSLYRGVYIYNFNDGDKIYFKKGDFNGYVLSSYADRNSVVAHATGKSRIIYITGTGELYRDENGDAVFKADGTVDLKTGSKDKRIGSIPNTHQKEGVFYVHWHPSKNIIDETVVRSVDVIIHLAVLPIQVSRRKSLKLMKEIKNHPQSYIGVITQKNPEVEDPEASDLYRVGVVARLIKMLPDGTSLIQGIRRFKVKKFTEKNPYNVALVEYFKEKDESDDQQFKELVREIKKEATKFIDKHPILTGFTKQVLHKIKRGSVLIDFVANYLDIISLGDNSNKEKALERKQTFLQTEKASERGMMVLKFLREEIKRMQFREEIEKKTREDLNEQQREYYLQQQMRTIQDELGGSSTSEDILDLQQKAKNKNWKKEVAKHFEKELLRLERINPQVSEYNVQRSYLDTFVSLPWGKYSKDKFDLKRAQKILDKDHFGLEKVKERIIEYLAVLKLKNDMKSPIICLYGPPGVGKTSLGKSIAESLGRKYVRMSLGGLRDESEIRGHRKTYIGAMPGRVLQNLKKAATSNPVFVLDEIDKLSNSHQGDPSAAMLEVLDPEQNNSFYDNYLEVGYDLSKVLFIATANNINEIPWALKDRMEMIEVSGYTIEEKTEIAKKYLLPKQIKNHGLKRTQIKIPQNVLEQIILGYTRESGVRTLEKKIAKVVRFTAKSVVMETPYDASITSEKCEEILGVPKMLPDLYENNDVAGVVTGLAWTAVGGDILFIESILSKEKFSLSITGNLGKVMKESATIALEYIRSHKESLGIDEKLFKEYKVHIHVPEGATPKDGPSAGVTILTSLVSTFTQRKVKSKLAMTGEITLRGKVLPVGGIKEKILAAKRAGIKEILLCHKNRADVAQVKTDYLKGLKFHYVTDMTDVLDIALLKQRVKGAIKF
uniref:Lon protease homolog n=1 Tax=Stylophora pistillata TaxID=50429 RepID=A0A2B4S1T6_STYPI